MFSGQPVGVAVAVGRVGVDVAVARVSTVVAVRVAERVGDTARVAGIELAVTVGGLVGGVLVGVGDASVAGHPWSEA